MNFGQPIRALFSDIGSLYALDVRAWKKLGYGKISLIHNAYNPTKVLLSLETDISEYVYQMKPKTKKKGQTWILKGDNTKTNSCDILAVRFSDKNISSQFKKMLEKAAKLKKKHEARHRRHHHNNNANNIAEANNNNGGAHRHHRHRGRAHAERDRDREREEGAMDMSKSEIFKPIFHISWKCPLCKFENKIGSYKCSICLTPQSDLTIIHSTQDQFVEILNIIQSNVTNHDKQHKLLNDLMSLTKKLMKNDHQHKSLDLNNRDIQQNLLSIRGVDQFLSCLGFVEDAPKKKLKCPEDKPHIYAVIAAQSVCQQCINQDSVRQIDEKKDASNNNDGEIGLSKTGILNECRGSVKLCMSVRRIIYVLKYYHEFVKLKSNKQSTKKEGGIYDYVNLNNEDIRFYCNTLLLDDMIHILTQHDVNNPKSDQFEAFYHFCIKELGNIKCDIKTCTIIRRNHRDRTLCAKDNKHRMDLYFGFNEPKEVNTQQIIDKLHCYIMHSFDLGFKLTQVDKNRITKNSKANEEEDNKEDMKLDKDNNDTSHININKLHQILFVKKKLNIKYINNMYKHDALKHMNRFVCDQSHVEHKEDIDSLPLYSENMAPIYYIYKKENSTMPEGNHSRCVYVATKYDNLKQEMLNNAHDTMSNEQWMDLWQKANDFIKCEAITKMDKTQSMKIYHLISVLLYCNFESLSYYLRLTFMRLSDNEEDETMMKRHQEFANWARALRETVTAYGTALTANEELYFGINRETLFNDFKLSIHGMISVSSEYSVNYMYCNANGVIVQLRNNGVKMNPFGLRYFACDALSDFVYEKERLFIGSASIQTMDITNIVCTQLAKDHCHGLRAIDAIYQMIAGKPLKKRMSHMVKQCIMDWFNVEEDTQIEAKVETLLKHARNDDDEKETDEKKKVVTNDDVVGLMDKLPKNGMKEANLKEASSETEDKKEEVHNDDDIETMDKLPKNGMKEANLNGTNDKKQAVSNDDVVDLMDKLSKNGMKKPNLKEASYETKDKKEEVINDDINTMDKLAKNGTKEAIKQTVAQLNVVKVDQNEDKKDKDFENIDEPKVKQMDPKEDELIANIMKQIVDHAYNKTKEKEKEKKEKKEVEKENDNNMLINEDDDDDDNNEDINDVYYKQLVTLHCNKVSNVKINLFLMSIDVHEINRKLFGYSPLKALFISNLYEGSWVNLELFCKIFPNLKRIYIENVNVSILKSQQKQQKTLNLSIEFMKDLLAFLKESTNNTQLNEIIISNVNESRLSINDMMDKYNESFVNIQWMISMQQDQKHKQLIFKRNRMNTATLKQISYEQKRNEYQVCLMLEEEDIIVRKSYDDFYTIYEQLLDLQYEFEVSLSSNTDNHFMKPQDLCDDLSQFVNQLLMKCKNNESSLLLSKVFHFVTV